MAEDKGTPEEAELEQSRMPFLQHLRELRDRVRNAAICFMAAFVVCWYFASYSFEWLRAPMFDSWDVAKLGKPEVVYTKLTEPFWVDMSIGMWAGIFVSSPFIFYQLWRFIAPGLYKRERQIGFWFAALSGMFFIGGALFCFYLCMPALLNYLLDYAHQSQGVMPQVSMDTYFDLTRDMMIAFGAVFELPMLIYFLAKIGLVTHRGLWKFNRWFIVLAFIVGAILTPSPDVVSQTLMAAPMVILYNLSIIVAWVVTRNKEKRAAAERAAEGIPDDDEDAEDDEDEDEDDEEDEEDEEEKKDED
jgi:sec-independent protein translocase protein TatC